MNGYQMHAQAYQKLLQREGLTDAERKDIESKIKVLSCMADLSEDERLKMFDTTAWNDVLKGYVKYAADVAKLPEKYRDALMQGIDSGLDTMNAERAERYYSEH